MSTDCVEKVARSDVENSYLPAKIRGINITVLVLRLVLVSHSSVRFVPLCCLQLNQKIARVCLSSGTFSNCLLMDLSEVEIGKTISILKEIKNVPSFYKLSGVWYGNGEGREWLLNRLLVVFSRCFTTLNELE